MHPQFRVEDNKAVRTIPNWYNWSMNLKSYIAEYPDFPEPGILFRDISPLLATPTAFSELLDQMETKLSTLLCTALIAIDARGFIFASALADRMRKKLILARKKGKLPGSVTTVSYSYEYAAADLEIQNGLLQKEDSVVIIDDVLATGNTIAAAARLIAESPATLNGILVALELLALRGRDTLKDAISSSSIHSILSYE
jgi:adenine phosphoribosyltransferase